MRRWRPVVSSSSPWWVWPFLNRIRLSMPSSSVTFAISLSAFVFLIFRQLVAERQTAGPDASVEERRKDDAKEEPRLVWWTFGLFAVAFAVALAVWISPTAVGRAFGSMVVAYFAMGALLATVDLFHYGGRCLVSITEREAQSPPTLGSPNYLPIHRGQVVDAWINEFVALFHGLETPARRMGTGPRPNWR